MQCSGWDFQYLASWYLIKMQNYSLLKSLKQKGKLWLVDQTSELGAVSYYV